MTTTQTPSPRTIGLMETSDLLDLLDAATVACNTPLAEAIERELAVRELEASLPAEGE